MTTPTLRTAHDLLAAVPFLLGFHPADSVVVVTVRARAILFLARHDVPADARSAEAAAQQCAEVARGYDAEGAVVIGYGPAAPVGPAAERLAGALRRAGVPVLDELRVEGDRYWSHERPPEGLAFRPDRTEVAAAAVFAGQVALPDRAAMADRIKSVGGTARALMTDATGRACVRMARMLDRDLPESGLGRLVRRAGRTAVRDAESRHRAGHRLTDDEVAWLGLLLLEVVVRDYACERPGAEDWRLELWADVLRRVNPEYAAPPACLLGYVAWQQGQGALARMALQRSLQADPDYRLAQLLDRILDSGIPPAELRRKPAPARRPRRRRAA